MTENARYAAEQDWDKYITNYNMAYSQYEQAAAEAQKRAAAEAEANAPLEKPIFSHVDENGLYHYYLNGKEMTFAEGVNPLTGTINPDVEKDTFGITGYQPSHITIDDKPQKLTKTGKTAVINGHEQNVWQLPDGRMYLWDDTVNKYVEYQAAARNFISRYMTREQAAQRGITAKEWKKMIMDGLHNVNLTADEFERLEKYYGLNL